MESGQKKFDIEKLLEEGNLIQIKPQGYSMYPLFVPGRDEVLIERCNPAEVKRGDVLLYRRASGILVLHRLYRRTGEGFFMVGDNQTEIEGPLAGNQIKGKMTGFIRKGKKTSVRSPLYAALSRVWLILRPVRPVIGKTVHFFKSIKND